MFIELAEHLRCPQRHEENAYCVLVPDEMVGRDVIRGSIACPVCEREYPVRNGVADFSDLSATAWNGGEGPAPPPLAAEAAQALLGLDGPGGYVVLLGSAARVVTSLAPLLEGTHLVGVNVSPDVTSSPAISLLRGTDGIPLASSMARGIVVGPDMAGEPWLAESVRVVLRGLRIVVCREDVTVAEAEPMAAGDGMWVGRKT